MFSFIRNYQNIFHLHSYLQWIRPPVILNSCYGHIMDFNYSNICLIISNFCFAYDIMMLNTFYMLRGYIYIFGKMSSQMFSPFLNCIVYFLFVDLQEFSSPLLNMCFENILFQSVACIFIFLTVLFIEQNYLILIWSNIPFFLHELCLQCCILKNPGYLGFSPLIF